MEPRQSRTIPSREALRRRHGRKINLFKWRVDAGQGPDVCWATQYDGRCHHQHEDTRDQEQCRQGGFHGETGWWNTMTAILNN
jgi:hypothetical protein